MNPYQIHEITEMRKTFALRNVGTPWTEGDHMRLRLAVGILGARNWALIGRHLGRPATRVKVRAYESGLLPHPKRPSRARYVALLKDECLRADVCFRDALSKSRYTAAVRVRWKVWAELRQHNYSLPGIGMAAGGYDHTAVLHGVRRHYETSVAA